MVRLRAGCVMFSAWAARPRLPSRATLMNAVKCLISKLIMGFTLELLLKKWAMHKRHDFVAKKHFQSIRFIAILDKYPHSYRTVSGFSRRMCHVSVQRKSAERSDGSTSRP